MSIYIINNTQYDLSFVEEKLKSRGLDACYLWDKDIKIEPILSYATIKNQKVILITDRGTKLVYQLNKLPEIRASILNDEISASLFAEHNDGNVGVISTNQCTFSTIFRSIYNFTTTKFNPKHASRVKMLAKLPLLFDIDDKELNGDTLSDSNESLKVIMASDHAGVELKNNLKHFLETQQPQLPDSANNLPKVKVFDVGTNSDTSVDYPLFAKKAALLHQRIPDSKVVLICGTGIGITIAGNRFPNIKGVVCATPLQVENSLKEGINTVGIGARITGVAVAKAMLQSFIYS